MPRRIIRRGRFIDRPARLIACLRLHPIAIRGLIVELFLYLIVNTVDVFLSLILMAMLVRSIMSLLMMDDDNVIYAIACTITEPFIIPVRTLFERKGWFQGLPLDASFFCAAMILAIVQVTLSFIPIY